MNTLMQRYYRSWIVPYLEGTLDARRRTQLEAQHARDPLLADELVKQRSVVERLQAHQAAGSIDDNPDRAALWPGIERRLQPRRTPVRSLVLAGGGLAAAAVIWGTLSIAHGPAATPAPPHTTAIIQDAQNLEPLSMPKPRRHQHSRVYLHPLLRPTPTHIEEEHEALVAARPKNPTGDVSADESGLGQSDGATAQEVTEGSKPTVRTAEEQDAAARFHLATGIVPHETREDPVSAEDIPPPDPTVQGAAPTDSISTNGTAPDAVASVKRREPRSRRHSKRQHPAPTVTIE